ncbi:MAG: hypothetical protein ACK2T3_10865 [Candidatus Promineifilaceae bacterium]
MMIRKRRVGDSSDFKASHWQRIQARFTLRILYFALLIAAILLFVLPASSHTEGKMQLSAEPAGPYKMTVFTSPDPAVTGEIHVAALIFFAEDASPVLDADVTVTLSQTSGSSSPMTIPANLGDSENKLLFEAIAEIKEPGLYTVIIEVDHADTGHGEAAFQMEVVDEGGFNWLYLIPVVIAATLVALWLVRRNRANSA